MGGPILAAAVAFALYLRTTGFDFMLLWDDGVYVAENPHLRALSADSLRALLGEPFAGLFAPGHMLSILLDRLVWGLDPFGYHLGNVVVHALNAALVHVLARRFGLGGAAALAVSLAFAVHPVNVENVAWVAQRKALLSTTFALLSMLAWLRFRDEHRRRWYAACAMCFVAAVLTKITVAGIPLILAAHELLYRPRGARRLGLLVPLLVAAVAQAAATALLADAKGGGGLDPGLLTPGVLLGTVYPTMTTVAWTYVRMLFWPTGLSAYYDVTLRTSFFEPAVLAAVAAWIITVSVIWRRGGTPARFWLAWIAFSFAPVSNLVPNATVFYADRYMYLPQVGVFALVALGLSAVMGTVRTAAPRRTIQGRRAIAGAVVVALVALASLSYQRTAVWGTELALWEDTAAKSPGLYKARLNLGVVYHRAGRLADARREYEAAARIWRGPRVLANLRLLSRSTRSPPRPRE